MNNYFGVDVKNINIQWKQEHGREKSNTKCGEARRAWDGPEKKRKLRNRNNESIAKTKGNVPASGMFTAPIRTELGGVPRKQQRATCQYSGDYLHRGG